MEIGGALRGAACTLLQMPGCAGCEECTVNPPTRTKCREPADHEVLGIHARYLQYKEAYDAMDTAGSARHRAAQVITRAHNGTIDDHILAFNSAVPDTLEPDLLQAVATLQLQIEHVLVIHFANVNQANRSSRQLHDDLDRFGAESLWRWMMESVGDSSTHKNVPLHR